MIKIIIKKDKDFDGSITGIFEQKDGSFLVLTPSVSKEFKTLSGAKKFFKNRGIELN